ncbi:MAG: Uma2 family endonuclease [Cyanophyceae cyanobacterium]
MIAEVLSKSTQSYDRDEKFTAYRTILTFQEYLLVNQYSIHAKQYFQTNPHQWIFTEYNDAESMISLSSIPCEIRLADLYENVELDA